MYLAVTDLYQGVPHYEFLAPHTEHAATGLPRRAERVVLLAEADAVPRQGRRRHPNVAGALSPPPKRWDPAKGDPIVRSLKRYFWVTPA